MIYSFKAESLMVLEFHYFGKQSNFCTFNRFNKEDIQLGSVIIYAIKH